MSFTKVSVLGTTDLVQSLGRSLNSLFGKRTLLYTSACISRKFCFVIMFSTKTRDLTEGPLFSWTKNITNRHMFIPTLLFFLNISRIVCFYWCFIYKILSTTELNFKWEVVDSFDNFESGIAKWVMTHANVCRREKSYHDFPKAERVWEHLLLCCLLLVVCSSPYKHFNCPLQDRNNKTNVFSLKTLGGHEQSAIHMVNDQEWRTTHIIKDVPDSPVSCCNCWHLILESSLPFGGCLICWLLVMWGVLALELEDIFSIWRNEKEIEKWILNGILLGGNDSQQSGGGGLAPAVCKVAEHPHCLHFGDKLGIICSLYKMISFCKLTLESNSFPGLFLLLLSWIWRERLYYCLPLQAATPRQPAVPCPLCGWVSPQALS